jgi:hypothetical protein
MATSPHAKTAFRVIVKKNASSASFSYILRHGGKLNRHEKIAIYVSRAMFLYSIRRATSSVC